MTQSAAIHWTRTTSYAAALAMGASGGLTPLQESRVAESLFWRSHWGRIVRGPAWGTFLGADHVNRLGGIDRVKAASGCARVVPLVSGGAFLQLTTLDAPLSEDEPDDERMAKLMSFLDPVIGKDTD